MRSIFGGLIPGGSMHHYIPSDNHPYSLCLRLVGPRMQRFLIHWLRPGAKAVTGYPAYFDHCTPRKMERLCERSGFDRISIVPFYGASDDFGFFDRLCGLLRLRRFCSGFVLSTYHPFGEGLCSGC